MNEKDIITLDDIIKIFNEQKDILDLLIFIEENLQNKKFEFNAIEYIIIYIILYFNERFDIPIKDLVERLQENLNTINIFKWGVYNE